MQIDRERIRQELRRIDRSQAWLARQAGISRQLLQHYLDGRQCPVSLYPRLAAVLGTTDFLSSEKEAEAA